MVYGLWFLSNDIFMIRRPDTGHAGIRKRFLYTRQISLMLTAFLVAMTSEAASVEIAILKSSDLKAYNEAIEGFKATAPATAIYAEYDLRGDLERGKQLAKKIRDSESSLVVAVGLKAAMAAKLEITNIPVLHMMLLDPLKHRLTATNMTGVLLDIPIERQLKVIRTFLPSLHQIGIIYDTDKTSTKLKDAEAQASIHEFQLRRFPVENEKEVPQQLRALLSESEALWLIPDSTVLTDESIRFILESALVKQIPVVGFSPELSRLGAVLSMSIEYREVGREAGFLAKRILSGEPLPLKPISVQRIKITVNQKTARYLGVTISKEFESLIDETY